MASVEDPVELRQGEDALEEVVHPVNEMEVNEMVVPDCVLTVYRSQVCGSTECR